MGAGRRNQNPRFKAKRGSPENYQRLSRCGNKRLTSPKSAWASYWGPVSRNQDTEQGRETHSLLWLYHLQRASSQTTMHTVFLRTGPLSGWFISVHFGCTSCCILSSILDSGCLPQFEASHNISGKELCLSTSLLVLRVYQVSDENATKFGQVIILFYNNFWWLEQADFCSQSLGVKRRRERSLAELTWFGAAWEQRVANSYPGPRIQKALQAGTATKPVIVVMMCSSSAFL